MPLAMKDEMRILVRKCATSLYLQSSGEWNLERKTAREFQTSFLAYWWAHEQKLSGIEILLAFDQDPFYDFVCLRL